MDAFPAFFPLADRSVAIAGEGEGAEAKARLFVGSPATVVRLVGPDALTPDAYLGMTLAFIAGDDEAWVCAAAAAARAAHVPVNVVDRPTMCDFTTPAVIDRGEVVAAIGTGGASPMLATMLRHDIEARIPEGAGRVAALFRSLQDEVRAGLPDANARRRFLRAALTSPAAEAALRGEMDRARGLLIEGLAARQGLVGAVNYVRGEGPAELLTLRAVRALAAADVLICDTAVDAEVLALARRDAERLEIMSTEGLASLVLEGLQAVRLTVGSAWRDERLALDAAGVTTEVLPVAR